MNNFALTIIEKEEDWIRHPYYCPADYPTVGHGFRLGKKVPTYYTEAERAQYLSLFTMDLSYHESLALLKVRIDSLESQVRRLFTTQSGRNVFDDLNDVRQAVIISMCFQMGVRGFFLFEKTVTAIMQGDFDLARVEMLDSLWFKDPVRGTPSRAMRHSEMMATGKILDYYSA